MLFLFHLAWIVGRLVGRTDALVRIRFSNRIRYISLCTYVVSVLVIWMPCLALSLFAVCVCLRCSSVQISEYAHRKASGHAIFFAMIFFPVHFLHLFTWFESECSSISCRHAMCALSISRVYRTSQTDVNKWQGNKSNESHEEFTRFIFIGMWKYISWLCYSKGARLVNIF